MTKLELVACKGHLHRGVRLDKKPRVKVSGFASLQQNKTSRNKLLLKNTHLLNELAQSLLLGVGYNGETQRRGDKKGATQTSQSLQHRATPQQAAKAFQSEADEAG